MPVNPKLPAALRHEIGIKDNKRIKRRKNIQEPRKKRKLYQAVEQDEIPIKATSTSVKTVIPKTQDDVLLEKDDLEIDYWEAKLGRAQKANGDDLEDGLDDLLDGLDLPRGESRLEEVANDDYDDDESGSEGDLAAFEQHDEDDFTNFPDEDVDTPQRPSIYEPYRSSIDTKEVPVIKYIPPALRQKQSANIDLRRQLNGLLNRLSSANIGTIVGELESMYRSHARGTMNEELTKLLLQIVSDKSGLLDSFVVLHAALVAALYKLFGTEFAANFVQQSSEALLPIIEAGKGDRQAINLMTLLSELYNYNVIAANLLYDYVRLLIANLNELNAEVLLVIIRSSGPQLRSDDPASLKDILIALQSAIKSKYEISQTPIPLRMKFMLDTMMSLKNNKLNHQESQLPKDLRTRLKKYIGTIGTTSEPLRVTLSDIQNIQTNGKWWLIGASWKDSETTTLEIPQDDALMGLARGLRLNNPIRKQIFITILSSSDHVSALSNLLGLRLKKSQEVEMIRVIVMLVASEGRYNPFYAYLTKSLSERHGLRKALEFCIWDFLDTKAEMRKTVNLAKFYGSLMGWSVMSLGSLKVIIFAALTDSMKVFLDILITQVFLVCGRDEEREEKVISIFTALKRFDGVNGTTIGVGLEHFMRKVVRHAKMTTSKEEKKIVVDCVQTARTVLTME